MHIHNLNYLVIFWYFLFLPITYIYRSSIRINFYYLFKCLIFIHRTSTEERLHEIILFTTSFQEIALLSLLALFCNSSLHHNLQDARS